MTEPIKRQWTLRIHSNNDGGGYIYSGDDVSYPEDDYLEVISADWVEAEIQSLKQALKEARHALDIKNTEYDLTGYIKKIDEVLKDE